MAKQAKWKQFSKEYIEEIVQNSKSFREVAQKLGYAKDSGGTQTSLKKMCEELNLDTSHFLGQGWNVNNSPSDIKPIEKYLNNEIPITSYKLKKRLLKEGLKKQKCEICNLSEWNDSIIPLELHHINGNNKDNSLSNLQMLCPNCHALTDNYRNRK